jgi:hypothetical protein
MGFTWVYVTSITQLVNECLFYRYIVSDCDSIQVMVDNHKWLGNTKEDVVAQVLTKGRQAYHTCNAGIFVNVMRTSLLIFMSQGMLLLSLRWICVTF